jgi:large-conductance mechanosensitive channel
LIAPAAESVAEFPSQIVELAVTVTVGTALTVIVTVFVFVPGQPLVTPFKE